MTTFPSAARCRVEGGVQMVNEPKQPKPEPSAPEPEESARPRPSKADEAREDGMPGYGQPDEDVREQSLPEQSW
ncbi:hypothetical protein [Myxococcus xanthus]|uniref:hypothetical protein n=1 Tax=Myxococcus xanthus TaxID=34 RepID=UPI0020A5D9AB|nr:hypothetical protein [Myxococcus xanthus]